MTYETIFIIKINLACRFSCTSTLLQTWQRNTLFTFGETLKYHYDICLDLFVVVAIEKAFAKCHEGVHMSDTQHNMHIWEATTLYHLSGFVAPESHRYPSVSYMGILANPSTHTR